MDYKIFDGKRYEVGPPFKRKVKAQQRAWLLRRQGKRVRVTKEKDGYYWLWVRR